MIAESNPSISVLGHTFLRREDGTYGCVKCDGWATNPLDVKFCCSFIGAEKKLETVEEHNDRLRQERKEQAEAVKKTGVACPGCGGELKWVDGYMFVINTYPQLTMLKAFCMDCKLTVDLER